MEKLNLAESVERLLLKVFSKAPTEDQINEHVAKIRDGMLAKDYVRQLANAKRLNDDPCVAMNHPPGHHFSPVVNPAIVEDYYNREIKHDIGDLLGIDFNLDRMLDFWNKNATFISTTSFPEMKSETHRYSYTEGPFHYGDAITLRAMIHHFKPKRIIEIGSGYSTACMLDSVDELGLSTEIVCIDPGFDRLRSLLRPSDFNKLELHETIVQEIPLERFSHLEENDILFIDSTHVLKTGSDVHYELFHILPRLKKGVIVHFHDCRFPLEYSRKQVFEKNYSWNEVYAVRALLMFSSKYKVFFFNSLFAMKYSKEVASCIPLYLRNPGSGLWIEVVI